MIIVAALLRGDETAIDHPHHITEVIKKTRRDAAQTPDVGTSFYEFSPRGFIERDIKNLGTIEGTIGKGTIFLWVSGRSWTKNNEKHASCVFSLPPRPASTDRGPPPPPPQRRTLP
jgi:hypothetical protein